MGLRGYASPGYDRSRVPDPARASGDARPAPHRGLRDRPRVARSPACGFYTFALAQLTGAVLHDMHLIWFALILAVSPCGDALTFSSEPSSTGWPVRYGALLVLGAALQGLRGETFAWPFACYPTFQWCVGTHMPDLVLEGESADGNVVVIDSGGNGRGRSQDVWGLVWSLAGLAHGVASHPALVAYWNAVDHSLARGAVRGRVVLVSWSVLPGDRDRPPTSRRVLDTFPLDPQSGAAF